jgi:hypothetical protein
VGAEDKTRITAAEIKLWRKKKPNTLGWSIKELKTYLNY